MSYSASVCGAIDFVLHYEERPAVIAVFDLVEDEFKTLPSPDFMLNKVGGGDYSVGHLSGCLCLSFRIDSGKTELWVMKEYGVKGSWTKILITESVNIHEKFKDACEDRLYSESLCVEDVYVESFVSPNRINDFTIEGTSSMHVSVLYNPSTKECKQVPTPPFGFLEEYGVTEYWTKISTVIVSGSIGWLYQFYYVDNNETMLWRYQNDKLMFWDSKDEELKNIKMECIPNDQWCARAVYEESLVSLNRINDFTTESTNSSFLLYV
ncbi:hypothetical protein EZV62_006220 [Acer yangbiense]|uniref:F-box associated domain-containing protein n=1 Tax=Acer yangbiense TaxID=1000413 RepID=A0A5C7IPV5_9ROSI|nr:hypothetical protein EZV62_006220 [Acer yangbiense]